MEDKCHFLLSSNTPEDLFAKVGNSRIWEDSKEKLLGILIDKDLKFYEHISNICKTANQKISALARVAKLLSLPKKKILMKSFIESQFSYCPLVWMVLKQKI